MRSGQQIALAASVLLALAPTSTRSTGADAPTQPAATTAPATRPANRPGELPLHRAIRQRRLDDALGLIRAGADVNVRDGAGSSPLYYAVIAVLHPPEVAKELVARGADVNARCIGGFTPLHNACLFGSHEVVGLLLDKGADPARTDDFGHTPLHVVAGRRGDGDTAGVADALLKHGADVNAKSKEGETPLDVARELGRPEVADLLVRRGGKAGGPASRPTGGDPRPATRRSE